MDEVKQVAYKYAVKNAFEHNNKAQTGAVVGKVKAMFPEVDLKSVMPLIVEVVNSVNKLNKENLNSEYEKFSEMGWELKNESKEKTLEELDWVTPNTKIITRVAPNPSGAMHFGHARPSVLTDEYVKKYGGKFILRFDDTDPKVKKPVAGIEKDFMNDYKWLGVEFHETYNASDRLERYYEIIEQLIKMNKAYICFCESEDWRKLIWESKACPCREKKIEEQLTNWKKMLAHEIKEGQTVVRIKTNLDNPDPSERDWWIAKIVDVVEHPNPRAKNNHVWPSYNLASAVDDHDMNVNLIIRGQEHMTNGDKQKELYSYFNWEYPHCYYHGKISKLGDMTLSKSKMKLIMDELGVERYDDPRMATIKAFRRRGFKPEAIRKVILDCGLALKEVKITTEAFAAANKLFIGEANEYPFFEEMISLEVEEMIEGEIEGTKFEKGTQKFFVSKKELLKNKIGSLIRLKKACNIKLKEIKQDFASANFISYTKTNNPILSWVINPINIEILMRDGSTKKGFTTKNILKEEGIIRIEGLGYANIEEKNDSLIKLVFAHE
ncbi:MAG: glutamate--tRNA ligase family protein [Candidatus Iainarchaeum sp.]|jgi:glutamyl-tRNA synthetase